MRRDKDGRAERAQTGEGSCKTLPSFILRVVRRIAEVRARRSDGSTNECGGVKLGEEERKDR